MFDEDVKFMMKQESSGKKGSVHVKTESKNTIKKLEEGRSIKRKRRKNTSKYFCFLFVPLTLSFTSTYKHTAKQANKKTLQSSVKQTPRLTGVTPFLY